MMRLDVARRSDITVDQVEEQEIGGRYFTTALLEQVSEMIGTYKSNKQCRIEDFLLILQDWAAKARFLVRNEKEVRRVEKEHGQW